MVVTPPRSGSGVFVFQTSLPVLTSTAVTEPKSCQPCSSWPKSPLERPRSTSPRTRLRSIFLEVVFCTSTAADSSVAVKT